MNRPTRFYSSKQERSVAKKLGGRQVANSGATAFSKGDVITDQWLLECKTCTTPKKSFSIREEWLEKNEEEAFAMNRSPALVFDFGNDRRYYVLSEKMFRRLVANGRD